MNKLKISTFYFSSTGNTLKLLHLTQKLFEKFLTNISNNNNNFNKNSYNKNYSKENNIMDNNPKFIKFEYVNIENLSFIKNINNFHKKPYIFKNFNNSKNIDNYINKENYSNNSNYYNTNAHTNNNTNTNTPNNNDNNNNSNNKTKNLNDKNFNNDYLKIRNYIKNADLIIIAFPVFFYQAPELIYAFFEYIKNIQNYYSDKNCNLYETFLSKPLILLSTNGGEPANSFYKLYKKYKLNNIIFYYSMHFEDNHPSLRQRFNPLISKGYPTKKIISRYKNKFKKNLIPFLNSFINKEKSLTDDEFIFLLKRNNLINKPKLKPVLLLLELINIFYSNFFLFKIVNNKHVNSEKCTDCKICINNCPTDALKFIDTKIRINKKQINSEIKLKNNYKNIGKNISFNISKCIGCYRCINICPFNAINTHISKYGMKYTRYIKLIKK